MNKKSYYWRNREKVITQKREYYSRPEVKEKRKDYEQNRRYKKQLNKK